MLNPIRDPFAIVGPATIAFSGGRTSAYMLWRILQSYNGTLPPDVIVCFANTGKERPETLDFVQQCGEQWSVPINWLEYRDSEIGFEQVNHNNASRNGEPFAALIAKRRFLPNGVARFCTVELKIRTQIRFIKAVYGWKHWISALGLRADEMRRVTRVCANNSANESSHDPCAPLAEAGLTKQDVLAFWEKQPFDLQLKHHEGNCDLCFLKRRSKLREIMYDRPDLAGWWIEMERIAREDYGATAGSGFRPPYAPNYEFLFKTRTKQEELELIEPDALDLCYCGD